MGGEKISVSSIQSGAGGSPPRGRGKAQRQTGLLFPARITPAWAGKRLTTPARPRRWTDHPRVGGEKAAQRLLSHSDPGSPPRGRGKEDKPAHYCELSRITPAWAGKSITWLGSGIATQDHPRVGGEKLELPVLPESRAGSPPRGRGKDFQLKNLLAAEGITPAWAGKSGEATIGDNKGRDHPRVGGEKRELRVTDEVEQGSPPRGRGKDLT